MEGFARTLSDQQVATLATYLTGHYGNPDVKVSAAQVKELRAGGPVSHLAALAQGAIAVGVIVLILLVLWRARRKRQA
jgi:cytochrome c553